MPATAIKKVTVFNPPIKLDSEDLFEVLLERAQKHYAKMGRSKNNLYFIKFNYRSMALGKRFDSEYPLKIAEIRTNKDLAEYLQDGIENFRSAQDRYSSRGFSTLPKITGLVVQGYAGQSKS